MWVWLIRNRLKFGYAKTHPCGGIYLKYWFIFIICEGFPLPFPFSTLIFQAVRFCFLFLMRKGGFGFINGILQFSSASTSINLTCEPIRKLGLILNFTLKLTIFTTCSTLHYLNPNVTSLHNHIHQTKTNVISPSFHL